jgi:anti-sigma B factor antagonist
MKIEIKERDGIVLIMLGGEIIGGPDATIITDKLHDLIDKKKLKIIVDMTLVNTINSSGLGILIGGLSTVRNHGGDLKLLHLGEKPKKLLRITQLDRVFDVFNDEEKAIESFF